MLAISAVFIGVGLLAIITEYSPESSTRYGVVGPFFGEDAKLIGLISILLGFHPLLFFCKTANQVAIFGSILFLLLMATIFGGIYFF